MTNQFNCVSQVQLPSSLTWKLGAKVSSSRGFHKSNFDFLPIPERSQFPPRDFVKKQRSAHTKRTEEEEELRPSLPSSLSRRRLTTKQTTECTVQQSSSERASRRRTANICSPNSCGGRPSPAQSVSQSVCRTPPPEKVRKTAACRRPRLSLSIDGDMSNKTTREGDIATRAAASMGGFVIAITDPASHSLRSTDIQNALLFGRFPNSVDV